MRSIIIAAGGTGGHISPGIALAESLMDQKQELGFESLAIHSLIRNKDNPDLRDSPCPVIWHNTPQLSNFLTFPFLFLINFVKTVFQFRKLNVDCVIAMGGYSSLPALLYAVLFKKKIFLCEQNRIVGKVTRVFHKYADKIAFSFPPVNENGFKNISYKILENPLRKKIIPDTKSTSNKSQVVNKKEKLNVLVMGGSQGARQINNIVINSMNNPEIAKNFSFRILTGTSLYDEAKAKTEKSADIISYSENMKTHYEWANLVIARSGAGVISECAVYGLPQILIPYPYAADNHQVANAEYFENQAGAWVLNQTDENNTKLVSILVNIAKNRESLLPITEKALSAGRVNASSDTIQFFFKE
ncbi:MAG TPA: UDP-N-acetylglucosamine--N-acetylmuramyl-(pentapeptide) pyrophosphoryl-undecaprenol N-acetylglucosamine transferase [Leptospiraceae bacterium]|nr:UDP-N-acetylglucosamine--N-acetylmuramyl-(pentapeptide) pyrophosphoryl-undecaprenol N-acetylglucosamine transferase [Leptospiraceae bacterium]